MVNLKSKLIVIIIASVILVCLYPVIEINGFFTSGEIAKITVSEGETFNDITNKLKANDIISSKMMFKIYTRIFYKDDINKIPAGNFTLKGKLSYDKIMNILINESTYDTVTVTIPEGYELREIADLFEKKGLCDSERFIKVANSYDFDFKYKNELKDNEMKLEGFLFPDTYTFVKNGTDEVLIINTMLKRFEEIFESYEGKTGKYSIYEIVTLASVIEREAKTRDDFYNVSSVFHNRLKRDDYLSYLQSCATVQYILKERKTVLSYSDTKIDSPYNTYKYPYLPIGPIASPGKLAIDAAINPYNTEYLYFLNDKEGKLHFSKTNAEHESKKIKYVN